MGLTFTKEIALGYQAPDFTLLEPLTGKYRNLSDYTPNKAMVVSFICNHCPYVKHINEGLIKLATEYIPKGVVFIAINPNDASKYPEDGPEAMAESALRLKYPFPYLYDVTQQTAKDFHAACTPDFSIFDASINCIYRGQFDDSRPGNAVPVTGSDIRKVLDALLTNEPTPQRQLASAGCSIKWK
jgi:thiol-disulfide isomerase/thioredoxin